jgi:hypothetical protein
VRSPRPRDRETPDDPEAGPDDDPRHHVFLSYTSADRPAVEELARRLVREGIDPWLDRWNLIPGDAWQPAIERALDDCASCAVMIGPGGVGAWQHEEMRAAIDRRVAGARGQTTDGRNSFRVIPVLLPGVERPEPSRLPTFLTATTWVEFRAGLDDEQAFHRWSAASGASSRAPDPAARPSRGPAPTAAWRSSTSRTRPSSSAARR